jgi:hypothetical protein
VCLGAGGCAQRVEAGREPVGAQHVAPGACIRSDTGCIPVRLAEAEGVEQVLSQVFIWNVLGVRSPAEMI